MADAVAAPCPHLTDTHYRGHERLGSGVATCTRTTFPGTGCVELYARRL